jgi:hypothetical protein
MISSIFAFGSPYIVFEFIFDAPNRFSFDNNAQKKPSGETGFLLHWVLKQFLNVSHGVNQLIISALRACPPPILIAIESEKDLWSDQISKIAKRFLRFDRSS